MHSSFSRARLTLVALLGLATLSFAQRPPAQPNAAEILHKMQKLNVLGSVLYIAAHPDDENTRLIAWLSNGKKVRTGYLSLTRGDGGQNLIGPELGDALGIIRTQELLEARRIDGGEQFFTRAVDFGYSKSAEESFEKWGKQEVLSDVVRVIRTFRPDVIITRFPTDGGGGHGHHTASAILAAEAFDLAGDPKAFPEQLQQGLEVWQPRRLFFNGSSWWRKDVAELAKTDPDWFSVDVGGYDPLLGLSYTEVAGRSRSMHKSQGFGAAETRGEMLEYLHLEKGDKPKTKDIFEGIDMTWGRVEGGKHIGPMLASLFSGFEPAHPENSIQQITQSYKAIGGLTERDDIAAEVPFDVWHWVNWSGFQLNMLAENCFGVSSEALTTQSMYSTNDSMNIHLRCLPRTSAELSLSWGQKSGGDVQVHPVGVRPLLDTTTTLLVAIPSQPFWLEKPHDFLFNVAPEVSTLPVVEPSFALACFFKVPTTAPGWSNATFVYNKWVDRVDGERIRPVYVTPVASVIPKTNVLIARGGPQQVEVEVEALTDSLSGQLNVTLPEG